MKMRNWCGGLLALLLSTMAHATLFDVSYGVKQDNQTTFGFSGYLNGDLVGNLVTNISNVHLTSTLWSGLDSFSTNASSVLSLDGSQNSFFFKSNTDHTDFVWWALGNLPGLPTGFVFGLDHVANQVVTGGFFPPTGNQTTATWQMSAVTAVPEPESGLLLAAGLGVIGLVVRRRTRSRPIQALMA